MVDPAANTAMPHPVRQWLLPLSAGKAPPATKETNACFRSHNGKNALAADAPSRAPLWELTALLIPITGLKVRLGKGGKGREERGREQEGWKREEGRVRLREWERGRKR